MRVTLRAMNVQDRITKKPCELLHPGFKTRHWEPKNECVLLGRGRFGVSGQDFGFRIGSPWNLQCAKQHDRVSVRALLRSLRFLAGNSVLSVALPVISGHMCDSLSHTYSLSLSLALSLSKPIYPATLNPVYVCERPVNTCI